MIAVLRREIGDFFGSVAGYLVIGIFITILGLMMWVLPDFSVFEYPYATLDGLFDVAPAIFIFLIPAICMRSFAQEFHEGTIEVLLTKPISMGQLLGGKFLACFLLVVISLLPTLLYVYSLSNLGLPQGNIDLGQVFGSYLGLLFLAASFTAISIFTSASSQNAITAFVLAVAVNMLLFYGMYFISRLGIFSGTLDLTLQKVGMDFHYRSISRGVLTIRDLVYFISVISFFLYLTSRRIQTLRN